MNHQKQKPTLRAAYDAAVKGEEYQRKLDAARKTLGVIEAKAVLVGMLATMVIMVFVGPAMNTRQDVLSVSLGIASLAVTMFVTYRFAWRMLRGNVYAKVYEDLNNQLADQDGVKRMETERELLLGNFGVGQRMVNTTRSLYDGMRNDYSRAIHWTGNTPEAIGVGNALARCIHGIDNMQRDLDVDFARGEARAATLLGVSLTMQQVIMELMMCLPFISKHLFNHE